MKALTLFLLFALFFPFCGCRKSVSAERERPRGEANGGELERAAERLRDEAGKMLEKAEKNSAEEKKKKMELEKILDGIEKKAKGVPE